MPKEASAQIHWAKQQLEQSNYPFAEETLERVGEVEGVIKRLTDGRLTVTVETMEDLIASIQRCRSTSDRCLRLVSSGADEPKSENSDNEHPKTE